MELLKDTKDNTNKKNTLLAAKQMVDSKDAQEHPSTLMLSHRYYCSSPDAFLLHSLHVVVVLQVQ